MPKAFDSKSQEEKIYKLWEESGYFKPENVKKYLEESNEEIKRPFVMTLPPPNANGDLHMGHTCGYSFHDAMGRFNRMTGHPTLLIAGKDHAGIQTETVFTKKLKAEGVDKWELGRDEFSKRCYEFCLNAADNARNQEKRIGLSADWEREFFTLDPRLTAVVYETFFMMYKDGLIYRDKRIINQCPHCRTALADVDTYHKEMPGIFAYIVYPFVDDKDKKRAKERFGVEGITVATTRPETMLGDTAVAVNPKDDRYREFIGHKVLLPIADREIPIIGEDTVDIETGTGALKVTPAHSPVDFEIAKRHNLLIVNVINEEGKMSGDIPERFKGMETIECSKALVDELDKLGLFLKIERIKHEVAVCERCDTPIQPIISNQWYVNTKPLAEKALDALKNGDTTVIPEGQQKALTFFFENIQPWCISRQLWWGHRIPIWYSGSKELHDWMRDNPGKTTQDFEKEVGKEAHGSGKIFASVEKPEVDPDWNNEKSLLFEEETDVFDTWFSSGQWPFSTTTAINGFDEYYPTDVMVHGRDILFWWSARMMMLGLYRTGKAPFHTIFLHGIINAPDGSKMSKSRGNTVSPVELFDKYGVDSLRLWYYSDALPGANAPLREEKIKGNRNFVNKIWNASRFVMMNIDDSEMEGVKKKLEEGHFEGGRVKMTKEHIKKVINYLTKHQYNLGAEEIREFFWHEYCDKWIEEVKNEIKEEEVGTEKRLNLLTELVYLLKENLKAMHPFIPYITESVWQELVLMGLAEGILMIEQIV
ncbi:MAG: Valine-tRNA ligase [candidate division WS6 bacterium GW2011_GWF2_39_15]|uniref:Valine--tRNA ligase n=1 Tax=candidate division WS6 bacterium GW2011_GWF2_39_15 TaxID=1619100 RepID=A0A0G0MY93_9BACT|nr:MAG: Valine-tRNA ligase [candidate division WS6 bacterium GW2011_GWF2_39_15]